MNGKEKIGKALLEWYQQNGRRFPWRTDASTVAPFKVLVAELLLQKTRAENVEGIYKRLVSEYPDPASIVKASLAEIQNKIEPLGLHRLRARRLKKICEILMDEFEGRVPPREDDLMKMPGIGPYIANAVLCFAFNRDVPLVDVNIVRIMKRMFSLKLPVEPWKKKSLWERVGALIPENRAKEFNYALLDLGSLVCTPRNPRCQTCPLSKFCDYGKSRLKHA